MQGKGVQDLVKLHSGSICAEASAGCLHAWRSPAESRVQSISLSYHLTGSSPKDLSLCWLSGDAALFVPLFVESTTTVPTCWIRPMVCQHPVPRHRQLLTAMCLGTGSVVIVGDATGAMSIFDCSRTCSESSFSACHRFGVLQQHIPKAHKGGRPINVLKWVQTGDDFLVVSGGEDGQIRIWRSLSGQSPLLPLASTNLRGFSASLGGNASVRGVDVQPGSTDSDTLCLLVGLGTGHLVQVSFPKEGSCTVGADITDQESLTTTKVVWSWAVGAVVDSDQRAKLTPGTASLTDKSGDQRAGSDDTEVERKIDLVDELQSVVSPKQERDVSAQVSGLPACIVYEAVHEGATTTCLCLRPTPESNHGVDFPVHVATGGQDMCLRIWDLTNRRQAQFVQLDDTVHCVAYSNTSAHSRPAAGQRIGDVIACAVGGRAILGKRPVVGQLLRLSKDGTCHDGCFQLLLIALMQRLLNITLEHISASAGADAGSIVFVDARDVQRRIGQTLVGSIPCASHALAFSHDATLLAVGCDNGDVFIFKKAQNFSNDQSPQEPEVFDSSSTLFDKEPIFCLRPGGAVSISTVLSVTCVSFCTQGRSVFASHFVVDSSKCNNTQIHKKLLDRLVHESPRRIWHRFLFVEYNGTGTWGGTMHRSACFAPVRRIFDLQVRPHCLLFQVAWSSFFVISLVINCACAFCLIPH